MSLKLLVVIVLALVAVPPLRADAPNPDASRVDLDAVFKGLHMDFCNNKCIQLLKPSIIDTMKMVNVYDNLDQVCKAYDQTLQCAKSNFCVKTPTFVLITSGLEDLCKTDKNTLMKNHEDCIKPKIDGVSQGCDSECHLVKEFADYSNSPGVKNSIAPLQLVDYLGGVCKSLACYLPCLRKNLNSNECPTVGNLIAASIVHPFYMAADFIGKMAPNMHNLLAQKLPQSCVPFIDKSSLNNMTGPV